MVVREENPHLTRIFVDVSKSLAIRVLQRIIVIVGILISTSLIPLFLAISTVSAVDLIQAEEVLHFCYNIQACGTFPLIVIHGFDSDLCKLLITLYACPFREVVLILTVCTGYERSVAVILGQQWSYRF